MFVFQENRDLAIFENFYYRKVLLNAEVFMLVSITESCSHGCTHCMSDAIPCDLHMSEETASDVKRFIEKVEDKTLLISGGEPFEHPNWLDIFSILWESAPVVGVLTNGVPLLDTVMRKEYINFLRHHPVDTQIYTNPKYYKSYSNLSELQAIAEEIPRAVLDLSPLRISSMGRAKGLQSEKRAPGCANFVLFCKQSTSLEKALSLLRGFNKFCTPSIRYDGTIALGESQLCSRIGNVQDDLTALHNNARNFSFCNNCNDPKELAIQMINTLPHQ